MQISEKILDKNHPNLATSYNNISTIYQDLNNTKEALSYINQAIKILEVNFPNGHPNLETVLQNKQKIESQ